MNFLTGRSEMGDESFATDLPAITLEVMAADAMHRGRMTNYPLECGGLDED